MDYRFTRYGDIEVAWLPELDGGGSWFGQDYVPVVERLFGKVGRVYEFCAGPAFIGFSLLGHGLCESLCLSDVNPRAVEAARETVRRNGLGGKVAVHLSDGMESIPDGEGWDLAVGNPPHFDDARKAPGDIITNDPGWKIHEAFFLNVGARLNPRGSVLLQENYEGSDESDFIPLVERGGLDYMGSWMYRAGAEQTGDRFYYLWARKRDERLVFSAEALAVAADLSRPDEPLRLRAGQKYRLEGVNPPGQRVEVHLCDAAGNNIFWRSLLTLGPGASRRSHLFYLNRGTYYLAEAAGGARLKRIEVL